jgi:hypothetical protein
MGTIEVSRYQQRCKTVGFPCFAASSRGASGVEAHEAPLGGRIDTGMMLRPDSNH